MRAALPHSPSRVPWRFLAAAVILAAGIATAGYLFYWNYEQHYRAEVERQLSAIAGLKADELVDWRQGRLADAAVFYKNAAFSALVRRYFDNPADAEARAHLQTWLGLVQAQLLYDRVFLLDTQGVERLSAPDTSEPACPHLAQDVSETLRLGRVTFIDFNRRAPDGPVHLEVLAPILDGQDGGRAIGVLVLRIDPTTYLYPYLSRWPTPSRTAETLIVRRDGNDALFLSNLRFQKDAALNLRVSLEEGKDLPAVKAAMGQEGIVEGADYRGVSVIAAVRTVPDSPWFLVARMDAAEVYAPVTERLWLMVVLVGVLVLGAGAGLGFVWRQQCVRFYRERFEAAEALRFLKTQIEFILGATKTGLDIIDADFNIHYIDPEWQKVYGDYTGRKCYEYFMGRSDPCPGCGIVKALKDKAITVTEEVLVKENSRPIQVTTIPFQTDAGEWMVAEVNVDITERKRAEEERRRLAAILEATPDFVGFADAKDTHILYINKAGRLMTGLTPDEDVTRLKISDVHPEWANRILVETVLPTASRDGVWTGECAFLHRDGHEIPALMVLLARKTSSGEVEVFSTISRDITDRKRMEHELRRLAFIAQQAAEGIAVADLEGNLQFVNDAWARMHGYESGAELVGKP